MNITPERIAVVRLDNLGDHVLGAGLLTALRAAFPAARIVQIAPAAVADLYARCPVLNHLLVVPGHVHYVQDSERFSGLLRELAAGEKFDLVINARYAEDWYLAAPMCGVLTAPGGRSVGFLQDATAYQGYDANSYYTQLVEAPDDLHASRYAGVLLKQLGLEQPAEPVVWFAPEDLAYVKERCLPDSEPYAVVGCGASFPFKLPALPLFAHVVQQLVSRWQRRVILVGGPADQALAAAIINSTPAGRVTNTVGELKLHQLSALVSGAELYVGPDSGPKHMAAATGIRILELGWVPSGYPRKSRGTGTAGWCWSAWSQRAVTVHPDPAGFVQRSQSPAYATLPLDNLQPPVIDAALETLLNRTRDPSESEAPEDYSPRVLQLAQGG
jgi:ADP-heptose:LPS heptosyltransferase